jgi:pimeloyl-ACP methyl ester carboxylesterase
VEDPERPGEQTHPPPQARSGTKRQINPETRRWIRAQTAAAWQTTPSTVLIGRDDQLLPQSEKQWAVDNLQDVRLLDNDHFIIFRTPEIISQTVLEALPTS